MPKPPQPRVEGSFLAISWEKGENMKYNDLNLGQIEAIVNKLGGMEGVQRFLSGRSEVVECKHVIDLDADPLIPYDSWKVEVHKKAGKFEWNDAKFMLYFSPSQTEEKGRIDGYQLRKELEEVSCFNANLLDYLFNNQKLIPEGWKKSTETNILYIIYFWGTIYRDSNNRLHVRSLCFDNGCWRMGYGCLNSIFSSHGAALRRLS